MRAGRSHLSALLRSAKEPTREQLDRFGAYLKERYQRTVPVSWEKDESVPVGFRMQVGSDVYDWTPHGRVRQFQDYLRQLRADPCQVRGDTHLLLRREGHGAGPSQGRS